MMAKNTKTPAMILQELTMKHSFPPPQYDLIFSKTGTHCNEFHYQVTINEISAVGKGSSKQIAKHDTAMKILDQLGKKGIHLDVEQDKKSAMNEMHSPIKSNVNCIMSLRELCIENKMPDALFVEISDVGPPHCREFTYECRVGSLVTQATSGTKKQARQIAAQCMFDRISDNLPELVENIFTKKAKLDDSEVTKKYIELSPSDTKPNLTIPVQNYNYALKKLLEEKNLKASDLISFFDPPTQENLKMLLNKLDLSFEINILQEIPAIVHINITTDVPLACMKMGSNIEVTMEEAIKLMFSHIKRLLDLN